MQATAGLVCGEVGAASMARYAAGELSLNDFGVGLAVLFLGLGLLLLYRNRSRVLLVDFMCYTPSEKYISFPAHTTPKSGNSVSHLLALRQSPNAEA